MLVGNASSFVPQLRKVGFPDVEVIPINELDLMSATLRRDAPRARTTEPPAPLGNSGFIRVGQTAYTNTQVNPRPSTPDVTTDPNAVAILKRVVDVKGGLDALKKVRTVVAEADTTFFVNGPSLSSKTRTYVIYPDKFRVDAKVQGADVVQVFNGGNAWARDPAGVHDVAR